MRLMECGQCYVRHQILLFEFQFVAAAYGASTMSLFTSTRSGQPWRMVMVG